jgi:hypothetical protein
LTVSTLDGDPHGRLRLARANGEAARCGAACSPASDRQAEYCSVHDDCSDVKLIKAPAPELDKAPKSAPAQAEALGQAKRPLEPKAKPSPTKKPATAASVRKAKHILEDDSSDDDLIKALEPASAAMAKIPGPAKQPPEPQDELSTLLEGKRKREELIAQQVAAVQKDLEPKMATGVIVNPELVAAYANKNQGTPLPHPNPPMTSHLRIQI